jgi:outer membrane protein OmpA-like peptidoglycan-associated protein
MTRPQWITCALLVGACATPPKPRELESFEQLKASALAQAAQKRAPALVEDSDKLLAKARDEWDSNDLEESRRDALMGQIKLKTAIALVQQDQAKARYEAADGELKRTEEEYGRVNKELGQTNEAIALLEKVGEARSGQMAEQQKLTQEQQRAAAAEKIAAAEVSIKNADTVDAQTYAKVEYSAAVDMLARAEAELKAGNYGAAQTSGEFAKQKADQAAALAKPQYTQAEENKNNRARDEALGRDAASIPGVSVRLERRGEVSRLIMPLRDLFVKKTTTVAPGHDLVLDQIAALLRKYPTYPVQIVGHTDSRGRHDELVARSLARAQSVLDALVSRGADVKRFLVTGQGPDEPTTDNRTTAGRNQNNRVELVFLYQ